MKIRQGKHTNLYELSEWMKSGKGEDELPAASREEPYAGYWDILDKKLAKQAPLSENLVSIPSPLFPSVTFLA